MRGAGISHIWHATVFAILMGAVCTCDVGTGMTSDVLCHYVSAVLHEAPAPRILVLRSSSCLPGVGEPGSDVSQSLCSL